MKGTLLPRDQIKFPLVKVIVSKIACESLSNINNQRFLTTDHRNVVRENFFRDIEGVTLVRNLFRPIRIINRTNSRTIWTPTYEDIDHNGKRTSFAPLKKKSPPWESQLSGEVGGYPQALLKVVNLQGMLDFHRNFVLVKNPSPCLSVNNLS